MVQMSWTEANDKLLLTVVLMIIAIAHGTAPNKILVVHQPCSAVGFICQCLSKLPLTEIGQAFYVLNLPGEILLMAVKHLAHVLVFQQLQVAAAEAHWNERALAKMSRLGSILSIVHTVDLVLHKLIYFDAAKTHLLVLYKVIFFEWLISRRLASLRRNFECMPISFWSAKALDHLTAVWADLAG